MRQKILLLGILAFLVLIAWGTSLAAPQAFDLSWWTVAGGGGTSTGETYSLQGTLGQAAAGYQMTGGEYTLAGGFWGGGALPGETSKIYLPLMLK